jgi:hypothetical protein
MITPVSKKAEYYIVDFDRTLADSDKLLDVFTEMTESYLSIPREEIEKADADVKARGDSFFTATYVRDRLIEQGTEDQWQQLEKQFIHESRSLNYLLPGAAELLEWLAANGKRYGILTYGNPLWQHLKLTAAGFSRTHHIILEQKEKGKLISSWQRSDGTFRIPDALGRGTADVIIMIDDKAVSFADFPSAPSHGYWVVDQSRILPSQEGSVPANVQHMNDLPTLLKSFTE